MIVLVIAAASSAAFTPALPLSRAPPVLLRSPPPLLATSPAASDGRPTPLQRLKTATSSVAGFLDRRYFLVGVVTAVALAAAYPPLGRRGGPLRPERTVAWGATCGIFLLSGLNLPTSELARAAVSVRLHALIQGFNLLLIPLTTVLSCNALLAAGLLQPALRDGMVVMGLLPTTINMCVALSRSSGGDEAVAIFNAVLGNLLGVLLTPYLLLKLVGSAGALSAADTLQKLATRVLLPLLVGQLLRPPLQGAGVLAGRRKLLSRSSESLLLLIVYSTFCDTFLRGFGVPPATLAGLLAFVAGLHASHLWLAWQLGGLAGLRAKQRITLTLTATQKTLALGMPLLGVVFAGRPDLGLLCTPLLLQHPLQLLVGSLLSPRLKRIAAEEAP
mmetsp:Transcript_30922/g.102260  ORF Transcript_30922/g.102260 Transcript_30922/m.102260 type:complete len:388 (-) Transcript_30922:165-1328(-)